APLPGARSALAPRDPARVLLVRAGGVDGDLRGAPSAAIDSVSARTVDQPTAQPHPVIARGPARPGFERPQPARWRTRDVALAGRRQARILRLNGTQARRRGYQRQAIHGRRVARPRRRRRHALPRPLPASRARAALAALRRIAVPERGWRA